MIRFYRCHFGLHKWWYAKSGRLSRICALCARTDYRMAISDEVVETALEVFWAKEDETYLEAMRAALESAGPPHMAETWDQGYAAGKSDAFAQDKGFTGHHANPYLSTGGAA